MTILVTGSGGRLGTSAVAILAREGHKLVCFDIAPPKVALPGVTYIVGNIAEFRDLTEVCHAHKIERVMHLAGLIHHATHSMPYRALQTNVMGLANILEAARLFDFKRIVYASSVAVYGSQQLYDHPATENDMVLPSTLYGATKVMNEATAAHYKLLYGVQSVGLRPHFSFGPGWHDGGAGQFTALISACALRQSPVWRRVYTPTTILAPIYAEEMSAAFAFAVTGASLPDPVYNVGGEEALSEREMVAVLAKISGLDLPESGSAGTEYNIELPTIDCSRFRQHSGIRQKYSFDEAVRACFESYKAE